MLASEDFTDNNSNRLISMRTQWHKLLNKQIQEGEVADLPYRIPVKMEGKMDIENHR